MRDKTIVIVMSETEKAEIQKFATADHMEVSPWCRMQIQRAMDQIIEQREARKARLEMIRKGGT